MPALVTPVGQNVIIQGVSWDSYTCLVADFSNSSGTRMAYDQGTLELMSPSFNHEQVADLLADIVKTIAEAQERDFIPAGSTTFRREDVERGFEPDASFYIEQVVVVRGRTKIDLDVDPPPDLIIEIDLTHPSLDKFPIYAALGVPEVWRYEAEHVHLYRCTDETYNEVTSSTIFPGVTPVLLTELIQVGLASPRPTWIKRVRTLAESLAESP